MAPQMRCKYGPRPVCRWLTFGCLIAGFVPPPTVLGGDSKPPAPNPAQPVNYIDWINQTYGAGMANNAWDVYRVAYQKLKPFEGDWGETLKGPWSDNPEVEAWLEANQKGLLLFRAAARRDECFFPIGHLDLLRPPEAREPISEPRAKDSLIAILLPHLPSHRLAVKGLIAEGYRDLAKGRHRRVWENAVLVLRSAHHLDHDAILIQRLVAVACKMSAYGALLDAFKLSDDRDALALRIASKLAAGDPDLRPLKNSCLFERLWIWDTYQRLFVPGKEQGTWKAHEGYLRWLLRFIGGKSDRKRSPDAFESMVKLLSRRAASDGFDDTLRELNSIFDATDEWLDAPYHTAKPKADQLDQRVRDTENPLLEIFIPSQTGVREHDERCRAQRRATHLIVHLFAYHAETGKFPDSLDKLDAPDLKELRIDPFSGRDFVYKKAADGFMLYSVAGNLKDNDGKHGRKWEEGDFVFWPVQD